MANHITEGWHGLDGMIIHYYREQDRDGSSVKGRFKGLCGSRRPLMISSDEPTRDENSEIRKCKTCEKILKTQGRRN